MGFFENWKVFRTRAEQQKLSPACQAVFYAIIGKFNDAKWARDVDCKDSELQRLTNIRSSKTIADAKSRLKLEGLIDFKTNCYYGTTYTLVQLASVSWSDGGHDEEGNLLSKVLGKEHGKEHGKVLGKEHGKEHGKVLGKVLSKVPLGKSPSLTMSKEEKKKEDGEDRAHAREPAAAAEIPAEVLTAWRDLIGEPNFYGRRTLTEWNVKFGAEKIVAALYKAAESNKEPRISIAFVRAILEGGKQNDGNREYDFKPYDWSDAYSDIQS